jgi:Uma2 family endonuclease
MRRIWREAVVTSRPDIPAWRGRPGVPHPTDPLKEACPDRHRRHAGIVAMALGAHVGPWNENDLIGLPEGPQRYELLEGTLLVSPPPGGAHQLVSLKLARILQAAATPDQAVVEAMGVRLPDGTVFIPDALVVTRDVVLDNSSGILDPADIALVVEIVSPGSRTTDRLTKPAVYARAGIASLWRVELHDGPAVFAYHLEHDHYIEAGSARPGERLVVSEPFPVAIDPSDLRP